MREKSGYIVWRYGKLELVDRIVLSDEEWKKRLTPEQFKVTRMKGTEGPLQEPVCSTKKRACTGALDAVPVFSFPRRNSNPVRDGRVISNRFRNTISDTRLIPAWYGQN